jgi:hypothetical protein
MQQRQHRLADVLLNILGARDAIIDELDRIIIARVQGNPGRR